MANSKDLIEKFRKERDEEMIKYRDISITKYNERFNSDAVSDVHTEYISLYSRQ